MNVPDRTAEHAVEIAAITLTTFNFVAAALVLLLVIGDNYRNRKSWWRISYERRVPFYLSLAILCNHVVFAVREFSQLGSGIPSLGAAKRDSPDCTTLNEFTWWAIWFPQVALAVRAVLMTGAVLIQSDMSSMLGESVYIGLVAFVSVGLWIPSHFLTSSPCSTFVMIFSVKSNSTLGLTGMITNGSLLLIICLSLIIIAWDICRATPPRRRSLYMEFEPALVEFYNPFNKKLLMAKKGIVCYGLGIFCQYACLLPNFTLLALSRDSEAAVYVASIIIHTTGIVLLFQYLFLRRTCNQCHGIIPADIQGNRNTQAQYPSMLRRTLSANSNASDENKRKRTRPYTTYGDGGEYLQYYRRGSTSSWDSSQISNFERPDRTASGRRLPQRNPGTESRPRTAERPKLQEIRRSRSLGGSENRTTSSLTRSESGKALVSHASDVGRDRVRPMLRRTPSGSIFREELDSMGAGNGEMRPRNEGSGGSKQASPSRLRFASTEDRPRPGSSSANEDMQHTGLRPILLPPMNEIYRARSALEFRLEGQEPSHRLYSTENTSETPTLTSTPMTRSISHPVHQPKTIPTTSATTSTSTSLRDFTFPFYRPPNPVDYEEDYSDWKPPSPARATTAQSSPTRTIIPTQTWPLALEALVEPDPPFAAEDRHYCITPTESRLSTITEEGTVRDSVVITPPPGILNSEHFPLRLGVGSSHSNINETSVVAGNTSAPATDGAETSS